MISFKQYLRPHGRTKYTEIERSKEVEDKAHALQKKGYRFEIEELLTGMVSMTIELPLGHKREGEMTLAHEICKNGPMVPEMVDKMVAIGFEREGKLIQ